MNLTILGCTGSIGVNTLDVIRRHGERYRVVALCAHRQHDLLFQQCLEFKPEYAVLGDYVAASDLQERLIKAGLKTQVFSGIEALERMASLPEVDAVMAAIVGSAGLRPTLAAAQAGKKILLANKEALVMAGPVFMQAIQDSGAVLLPIDSEHNAIFQSLPSGFKRNTSCSIEEKGIRRLLLTASGGPFLNRHGNDLETVTPAQAVAHPNWVMGQKISVDSATMMNKGLEVIEAHWLFGVAAENIDVVIHPQSVIHSMVEYLDGSVIAQLGNPDMRTPIAHALAYPERIEAGVGSLDFFKIGCLEFQPPDMERFPCLALAYQALRAGGSASTTLNAANEIAVQAFLDGKLSFSGIPRLIAAALDAFPAEAISSLAEVLAADSSAREFSLAYLAEHATK